MICESDIIFKKQKQKRNTNELRTALEVREIHIRISAHGRRQLRTHVGGEDGRVPALQHLLQLVVSGGFSG